ncbi:MAG: Mu transposase C-terminal domain-containing protein [Eubacteriales bacterium]|nr:Mu transposase C-terminal domain-containing protein [Eubacteriales bacterium]
MLMRGIPRKVMVGGIVNVYGKPFRDVRLLAYVGEWVLVNADPDDLRSVTVYDNQYDQIICEALEA